MLKEDKAIIEGLISNVEATRVGGAEQLAALLVIAPYQRFAIPYFAISHFPRFFRFGMFPISLGENQNN